MTDEKPDPSALRDYPESCISDWGDKDIAGTLRPGECVVTLPFGGTIDMATLTDPFPKDGEKPASFGAAIKGGASKNDEAS